jgi:hypothetical protein
VIGYDSFAVRFPDRRMLSGVPDTDSPDVASHLDAKPHGLVMEAPAGTIAAKALERRGVSRRYRLVTDTRLLHARSAYRSGKTRPRLATNFG